jgi:pyruvate, water dikinase
MKYILSLSEISIQDIALVGGKNASLGEMYNELTSKDINIPNGFAITADAYRLFCKENNIEGSLIELLTKLDNTNYSNLNKIGYAARSLILQGQMPDQLAQLIRDAYRNLSQISGNKKLDVAVRSSATAEDLPTASFAGRMESFLNIHTEEHLLKAVQHCYASLFTDRAIKYRFDMGFADMEIAISVCIQQMVRSDKASSGVAFTIDPDSGFEDVIVINSCWGLGENIVQGRVTPDEFIVFKPTLCNKKLHPILKKTCGRKEYTMVYNDSLSASVDGTIINIDTPEDLQQKLSLSDAEVIKLANWCNTIEQHYGKAMDIEWAKDGITKDLYIVQARPETVHTRSKRNIVYVYSLKEKGQLITTGIALGNKIATGTARILRNPQEGHLLKEGEILVTDITNPDWDPLLKKAAAIITNKGGRTSHAAIVARELGTVAIVGCGNATEVIQDGQQLTVDCSEGKEGKIYNGILLFEVEERDFSALEMPKTAPMLILADPEKAFEMRNYPNQGVGLLRLEFAITNSISIHPLALIHLDKVTDMKIRKQIQNLTKEYEDPKQYFIHKLSEAVGLVAAAFYPKDVIVRLSDFKSNEYANLLGGKFFEPKEENPMLGLRGASRYYSDFYRKGFELECKAITRVRDEMGLTNVKLMIPFCRTIEEGKKVLAEMAKNGLVQGENNLEVYVMVEIPSNVLLADEFAELFDGFSIGSNDLTQLTLGLDRDSSLINYLFSETNPAVMQLISTAIRTAKAKGIKIGLCGQGPSDLFEFADFLVQQEIDSISFNPDALIPGIENILQAEKKRKKKLNINKLKAVE